MFQALEAVNEDNRDELHIDLEMWTEGIVRHSMTVAHLCYDNHRDVIIKTCQRVSLSLGMGIANEIISRLIRIMKILIA